MPDQAVRAIRWLVFAVLCAMAGAVGDTRAVVTQQPFVASQDISSTPAETLLADPRLSRRLSLHGMGVPAAEVLAKVRDATGVPLAWDKDLDIGVVVAVDDVEASRILRALVLLLNLRVREATSRRGDGPEERAFRVARPQVDREQEARARAMDLDAFRQRMEGWRARAALADPDAYAGNDKLSGNATFTNARGGHWKPGLFLSALSATDAARLYQGQKVVLAYAGLPPTVRKPLAEYLGEELGPQLADRGPESTDSSLDQERSYRMPEGPLLQTWLVLWMDTDLEGTDRAMHVLVQGINLSSLKKSGVIPANRIIPDLWSREYSFGGLGPDGSAGSFSPSSVKKLRQMRQALEEPFDPSMELRLKDETGVLGVGGGKPFLLLWGLHTLTRAPLLCRFHETLGMSLDGIDPPTTLGDLIDWIQEAGELEWRPIAQIHTFTHRRSREMAHLDVPIADLRRWRAEADRAGSYSVQLLSEIAQMGDGRLGRLQRYGSLPGMYLGLAGRETLAAFRLWGASSAAQRARMLGPGLTCADLLPGQLAELALFAPAAESGMAVVRARTEGNAIVLSVQVPGGSHALEVHLRPIPFPRGAPKAAADELPLEGEWREAHPRLEAPQSPSREGKGSALHG
ncbi:MAG TPA: hypothetical protein VGN26_21210 [Armatimonadota bacterium]|jgi:hypothetical protein